MFLKFVLHDTSKKYRQKQSPQNIPMFTLKSQFCLVESSYNACVHHLHPPKIPSSCQVIIYIYLYTHINITLINQLQLPSTITTPPIVTHSITTTIPQLLRASAAPHQRSPATDPTGPLRLQAPRRRSRGGVAGGPARWRGL